MDSSLVVKKLKESINVKSKILSDRELIEKIKDSAELIVRALKKGKKVIFCGNGGSAADAQHLAAELMGKFYFNRPPLPAFSLTVNTSVLTAIGNDFGYEKVFVRQLQGIGEKEDVIVGISTSGDSKNVIEAFEYAKNIGMNVIAFTGKNGGKMKDYADVLINVPSEDTPRIQESHITIGHIICEIVERSLFNEVIE